MLNTMYIFEDHRDEVLKGAKRVFTDRSEAMNTYDSLAKSGYKINCDAKRVMSPSGKTERVITYEIYADDAQ